MNLKILAVLTTVIFMVLVVLGFVFSIPVAYVPENPTYLEFVFYHIVFMTIETIILASLFIHMLKTADIDLDTKSLKKIFD